jgi:hypothetical protein
MQIDTDGKWIQMDTMDTNGRKKKKPFGWVQTPLSVEQIAS